MNTAAADQASRWWASAANPPCSVPWCEAVHEPDEFAGGAALKCWKRVGAGDGWEVIVYRFTSTNGREPIKVQPIAVEVLFDTDSGFSEITTPEGLAVFEALAASAKAAATFLPQGGGVTS